MFTFNRNYDDFEQVAQFIGDFARVRQEIIDARAAEGRRRRP